MHQRLEKNYHLHMLNQQIDRIISIKLTPFIIIMTHKYKSNMNNVTGIGSSILETLNIILLLKICYDAIYTGNTQMMSVGIAFLSFINMILIYFHLRIRTCIHCNNSMNNLLKHVDVKGYRTKSIHEIKRMYYALSMVFHIILFMHLRFMMYMYGSEYLENYGYTMSSSVVSSVRTYIIMLIPTALSTYLLMT